MQDHPIVVETTNFMARSIMGVPKGYKQPALPKHLAALLGCPGMFRDGGTSVLCLNRDSCDEETLAARKHILPKLFSVVEKHGWHGDRLAVLAALSQSKCWEDMLNDLHQAYTLALALIDFSDSYFTRDTMCNVALPHVLEILNSWLSPNPDWVELPGVRTVCQHFFGDPWCAFMLPGVYADKVGAATLTTGDRIRVCNFIAADKPPFLYGLCPAQDASAVAADAEVILPRLDAADQVDVWVPLPETPNPC
jgi:hypothetical protein